MAKKQSIYQKNINNASKNLKDRISGFSSGNSMDKSIENYQKRVNNIGVSPETVTDKRNPIEKALNLPEDQNFLFDIFELINRPQQGLFGAIQAAQENRDIGEGFMSGLLGEKDYYFGDILRNAGVNDDELFTNPLSGDSVSAADILGFAGDVFLDPVDIPLFAAKPVNEAGKVIKGADKISDATKYAYKFDPLTALTQKGSKSLLETTTGIVAKETGKAIKGGINFAIDASDLNTVKKLAIDNKLINKSTKVTKEMLPELITKLDDLGIDVALKSDSLNDLKQIFNRTFNYKKSIPDNLYEKINQSNNLIDLNESYAKGLKTEIIEKIEKYATKNDLTSKEIDDLAQLYINAHYNPKTGIDYYVENALSKSGKSKGTSDLIRGSADEISQLKKTVEKFIENTPNITDDTLSIIPVKGGAKLKGKPELLEALYNNKEMRDALSKIKFGTKNIVYSDIAEKIKNVNNLYKNDKDFREIVNDIKSSYKKISKNLQGVTNGEINLNPIVNRSNYARTGVTEKGQEGFRILEEQGINVNKNYTNQDIVGQGSKNTFKARTQSPIPEQREIDLKKELSNVKKSAQNKLETLKEQRDNYTSIKKSNLQKQLNELNLKEDTLRKNFNLNKDKLNMADQTDLANRYNKEFDNIKDLIDDEVLKKANKISKPELVNDLAKSTDNYIKKSQKLDTIKANLARQDLTTKQIKSYTKQFDKAFDDMIKAQVDIIDKNAKLKGAVEETFIKEAGKLANKYADKSAKLKSNITKTQNKTQKTLDKIQNITKSFEDTSLAIKKKQANLKLQLEEVERLIKNPKDVKKKIKEITDQIAEQERIVSVIDSLEGTQFFATEATAGLDSFIKSSTKEVKAMKNYNEILLKSGLENENVVKFIKRGQKFKSGPNMVAIDPKVMGKITNYLESMKDIMPKESKYIDQFINNVNASEKAFIDKDLLGLITFKPNKEDANLLLKTMDKANNLFKKTSTLSPGFHLRNIEGNWSNMGLSGVSIIDRFKAYKKAFKLSDSDYIIDLVKKNANKTLSVSEKSDWKVIKQFIQSGAMGTGKNIRDLGELIEKASIDKESAGLFKKVWDGIFSINAKANEKFDNLSRLALLTHATDNPKYITKLGAKNAIDAMHQVLFDPQNMSPFERKYIKRLIPFYTFTKQNLIFQAKNIVNNTSRYNRLIKEFNKTYDAVGKNNYRQYQKENFELPLFNTGNDLITLKSNLPISDLGEYLDNPFQRMVSSTTPLIKTPFEQVTGVDTFTGRDISDRSNIEALFNATGLNNLTTKQIEKIQKLVDAGDIDINTLATVFPSLFRTTNANKIANQQQYEELLQYQDYIKQLKSQGIDVPTIKELTNTTSTSLKDLKKRRNRILKRRSN